MTAQGPSADSRDIQTFQDVVSAAQSGELGRATGLAERALAGGLEHPLFYKLRGLARQGQGRVEEAVADFRAALADTPNDVHTLNALGLSLARAGRPAEALPVLETAISLQPDFASAHFSRGWTLENLGDLKGAGDAYARALQADPNHAQALGGLANLAARRGDWANARLNANGALALDARDAAANIALAMTEIGEGELTQAEARLRSLTTAGTLGPHERGVALTLLGDALDGQESIADAFAAYDAGNSSLRALYAQRFGAGGPEAGLGLVNRLNIHFRGTSPELWRRGPPDDRPDTEAAPGHVFLIGFPRSGTTLLGQVLATHPDIVTLDEQETLARPAADFLADAAGLQRLTSQSAAELATYRDGYWRHVRGIAGDLTGRVFVDKLPMNTVGLPLITKLFPKAKVIFLRRDPRDVVLSCFRRQFVPGAATWEFTSLMGTARFYDAVMRLAQTYAEKLEFDLHTLRYEDLVADFAGQTRALCDFLNLEWTPDMGAFGDAARTGGIATPSAVQLTRGLYAEGVDQWRRYSVHLAPVLEGLAPWIERFGYAPY